MYIRRTINFSGAMRDMRLARRDLPNANMLATRAIEAARAQHSATVAVRAPLASAAGYDRRAIMTAACARARAARLNGSRETWRRLISWALTDIWSVAKSQSAAWRGTGN